MAALTPLLAAALPGPRIPQVVFFLIGGVIIGPHALGVADTASVQLVANVGLGFLFLLAGYAAADDHQGGPERDRAGHAALVGGTAVPAAGDRRPLRPGRRARLAEIGLRDGKMLPSNAAALVGAGALSVLVFPAIATAMARKDRARAAPAPAEPVQPAGAAEPAGQVPQARHPADGLMHWHR